MISSSAYSLFPAGLSPLRASVKTSGLEVMLSDEPYNDHLNAPKPLEARAVNATRRVKVPSRAECANPPVTPVRSISYNPSFIPYSYTVSSTALHRPSALRISSSYTVHASAELIAFLAILIPSPSNRLLTPSSASIFLAACIML